MLARRILGARFCLIDVVTAINCCESNALLKAGVLAPRPHPPPECPEREFEGKDQDGGGGGGGGGSFFSKVFAVLMEVICLPVVFCREGKKS